MSLPDESHPVTSFVQEEMIENLAQTMTQFLTQWPPVARLRLLAFMHLVEQPETMKALLEVTPSGSLRLTLDTDVTPGRTH